MIYDLAIIGAGPAGLSAALYAGRMEIRTVVIAPDLGGQIVKADIIENYPGLPTTTGERLIKAIKEQVERYQVDFIWQLVEKVEKKEKSFTLSLADGERVKSKTVILAFGKSPRQLKVPGEKELIGKGVGYCAICDMPFFKDKRVAIVGGGNSAIHAVMAAENFAKEIYLIHRRDQFRAERILLDRLAKAEKKGQLKILTFTEVAEIIGKDKVTGVKTINSKTKQKEEIDLDGVFVEIGFRVNTELVKDLVDFDKGGEIKADLKCQAKTPGLFVAGDITASTNDQITIGAGQGANAAISASQYLRGDRGEKI